jgi:hypothetical protein
MLVKSTKISLTTSNRGVVQSLKVARQGTLIRILHLDFACKSYEVSKFY